MLFLNLVHFYLLVVLLYLLNNLVLLQFELSDVSLVLLLSFSFLDSLLFVEYLPGLRHVLFLLGKALISHHLLLFDLLEEVVLVKLLDFRRGLLVVLETFSVRHLCLVLLPVKEFLAKNELFLDLHGGVAELIELFLKILLLDFTCSLGDLVHPAVRILGHLNLYIKTLLVDTG